MTRSTKRVPLYSQIRDYVLANIQHQHWRTNDQLPTEIELAEKFNVSRFTVKKALGDLVEEGIIYRIQGKGSFVAQSDNGEQKPSPFPVEPGVLTLKPIVYITPHIQSSLSSNILAGAEAHLSERGYSLIVKSSRNDQETERRMLQESVRAGACGILVFPVDGESYNEDILKLSLNNFPVVVLDRYLRGVETNCVCSDNVGGAYDATSHLIGLGHRRIAFISVHNSPTTSLEERLSGYERALIDRQLPIGPRFNHFASDEDKPVTDAAAECGDHLALTAAAIRPFLERNPALTAVFAATAHSGLAAMLAARDLGIQVPEQLSVIFFDDIEYASLSRIPPSCVVQQEHELGAEAANLLLSIIDNPHQARRKITLPPRIVLRQSTAPSPDSNVR